MSSRTKVTFMRRKRRQSNAGKTAKKLRVRAGTPKFAIHPEAETPAK
jgi:hypothetical protein